MLPLGQRLASTALRLLEMYGDTNVVFTRAMPANFDPTTGQGNTPVAYTYTSQGVSSNFTQAEMSSSNVQYGDMKYTIYPPQDGTVPAVGDTVQLNGIVYRIMNVVNTNLQNTTIIYDLQLRV